MADKKDGKIRFDEAFLQEHPEFRNYQVERKGKDYVFTQISEEGITLEQARNIKKLYAGATWALDQIVADSPVGEFLKECFPRNKDYKKILSLAYFLILNQNNSVSFYEACRDDETAVSAAAEPLGSNSPLPEDRAARCPAFTSC